MTPARRLVPLVLLLLAAGCATVPQNGTDLRPWGIAYRLNLVKSPRPNRIHVLKIDLAAGRVEPAVVVAPDPDGDGPAEAALTHPFALAAGSPALAFVNTNPWGGLPGPSGKPDSNWREGQPVVISGLALSNGVERSAADRDSVSIRFTPDRRVVIGDPTNAPPSREGVGGFSSILRAGEILPKPDQNLAPRTAIGTDKTGRRLWLVVVDGRQAGFSEGMSIEELGRLMKDLGCRDAVNMDGGGSSVMGLAGPDGALRLVNSPSDRFLGTIRIRPLPMILTLRPRQGK